ncbi:hypothetical protein OHR86_15165 [Streptomyces sp. NBC_00441]|uniref:hypothetical protein n=1 Tax=Streptomyces sp. NBC_00441 TaxID=2975742 RepID=UPI002E293045|nr:hypothetical protein [Streptomyces sp. NBC_00441]
MRMPALFGRTAVIAVASAALATGFTGSAAARAATARTRLNDAGYTSWAAGYASDVIGYDESGTHTTSAY